MAIVSGLRPQNCSEMYVNSYFLASDSVSVTLLPDAVSVCRSERQHVTLLTLCRSVRCCAALFNVDDDAATDLPNAAFTKSGTQRRGRHTPPDVADAAPVEISS